MRQVITEFDHFLAKNGLEFEAVIIGGAALNIMEIISRITSDVDFLDPEIPSHIKKASIEFARSHQHLKLDPNNWFNNGPRDLIRDLPPNWRANIQKIFEGESITLWTLGRLDLLRTKLYACSDRDTDYNDCLALNPSPDELNACKDWVLKQDASELWPERVEDVFRKVAKGLGHE